METVTYNDYIDNFPYPHHHEEYEKRVHALLDKLIRECQRLESAIENNQTRKNKYDADSLDHLIDMTKALDKAKRERNLTKLARDAYLHTCYMLDTEQIASGRKRSEAKLRLADLCKRVDMPLPTEAYERVQALKAQGAL